MPRASNVHLHLLDARNQFSGLRDRVERCFDYSVAIVSRLIPVDAVDVIAYVDPDYVIPELGISGFCTAPGRLYIPLDPAHPQFDATFEQRFLALLAHELHHCARRNTTGYADTLGEALITEGLACAFEAELPNGSVPFYANSQPADVLMRLRERAYGDRAQPLTEWGTWFFGDQPQLVPRHAGYAVGYSFVAPYLQRTGRTAAQLWDEPAQRFLDALFTELNTA